MKMTELKDSLRIIIERKNEQFNTMRSALVRSTRVKEDIRIIRLIERIDGQRMAYRFVLDAITGNPTVFDYIITGKIDNVQSV